jgi:hypothetical protein
MANRHEVMNLIAKKHQEAQTAHDLLRKEFLSDLHNYTHNDTIMYSASFNPRMPGVPPIATQINDQDLAGFMSCVNGLKGDKLDLIIHSQGGLPNATVQIVQYLRDKYSYIRAIIPQNAMSAACMLACACDEIIMGRQSAVGPIDPQMTLPRQNGTIVTVPAHSILSDFRKAKEEIGSNPETASVWLPKLMEIPIGFLDFCEKTIEMSKSRVAEWLDLYMFKNDTNKQGRSIADWLGNFDEHMTHGRPINYRTAREKGFKINLLEDDAELQDKVLSVYHATQVTFELSNCVKIIENHLGKGMYTQVQATPVIQQIIPQQA